MPSCFVDKKSVIAVSLESFGVNTIRRV